MLTERTTSSGVDNVQQADQRFPLSDVYQQTNLPSLGRVLFKELKLAGPSGGIFVLDENPTKSGSLALIRGDIECYPSSPIKTEITPEAYQDLIATYGSRPASTHIAKMLRSIANKYENGKLVEFLGKNAVDRGTLTLTDKLNAETRMFEIINKVQTCVLEANSKTSRSFLGFAIVPYEYVSSVMATVAYQSNGRTTAVTNESLAADIGITSYYVNPEPADKTCYVGIRCSSEHDGSCYFGSYTDTVQKSVSYETGSEVYYIYDRFGFAMNPLHTKENPMLFKFTIA